MALISAKPLERPLCSPATDNSIDTAPSGESYRIRMVPNKPYKSKHFLAQQTNLYLILRRTAHTGPTCYIFSNRGQLIVQLSVPKREHFLIWDK